MTKQEYRVQLMKELIEIVGELGWSVAIPEGDENEEVDGLIIGTSSYVDKVMETLEDANFKM